MKAIFADTFYWIALLNPKDTWYPKTIEVSQEISNSALVITQEGFIILFPKST